MSSKAPVGDSLLSDSRLFLEAILPLADGAQAGGDGAAARRAPSPPIRDTCRSRPMP